MLALSSRLSSRDSIIGAQPVVLTFLVEITCQLNIEQVHSDQVLPKHCGTKRKIRLCLLKKGRRRGCKTTLHQPHIKSDRRNYRKGINLPPVNNNNHDYTFSYLSRSSEGVTPRLLMPFHYYPALRIFLFAGNVVDST